MAGGSYTATTLSGTLTPSNLHGATLTVSLGDNETTRTNATSPETFNSSAAASHFSLSTTGISGLSISNVSATSGASTATLTLSHTGEAIPGGADVKVTVAAAAHSGSNALTSKSKFLSSDYDQDDDGLIEIRTLQQLNAVRWDLDGNGTVTSGNQKNYSAAFGGPVSGMGCPATGCTGYELDNDLDFDTGTATATWIRATPAPTRTGPPSAASTPRRSRATATGSSGCG